MVENEYVISLKIKTDQPLMFNSIPEIIREEILNGSAVILTAETYDNWKEEQEAR